LMDARPPVRRLRQRNKPNPSRRESSLSTDYVEVEQFGQRSTLRIVPRLRYEKSMFPKSNRDGIALGKGTNAAPVPRVGDLREDLPAGAQHLRDVSVHFFHAEESLPMVGSVPASLVGEGFNLHFESGSEYLPRNLTSRFSLPSNSGGCTRQSEEYSRRHNHAQRATGGRGMSPDSEGQNSLPEDRHNEPKIR